MPRYDPHPVLDRDTAACLRLLSDPQLDDHTPIPELDPARAELLVRVAGLHGTLPVTRRHIRSRIASGVIHGEHSLAVAMAQVEPTVVAAVGQTMQLRHWGDRVAKAFRDGGVSCTIVKGPVATALYPFPSDRLYTDIDFVIPPNAIAPAREILLGIGFFVNDIPGHDAEEHCEFKFALTSSPTVQIEVHTDLIHSRRQRNHASVGLATIEEAGEGTAGDPTALLFIAGVHAAFGHQFERLDLLVDVLQAGREHAGPVDRARLERVCRKTGTLRAVAASLALAGRIYNEPACTGLARHLLPKGRPLEWRLVSPKVVLTALSASGWWVSWRRKVFRQLISLPAPGA